MMSTVGYSTRSNQLQRGWQFQVKEMEPEQDGTAVLNEALNRFFRDSVQLCQDDAERRRDLAFTNVQKILKYVHQRDARFAEEPARVGSYWQGLKVDRADEFDYSIILDGIGPLVFATGAPAYYGFSRPVVPDLQTLPEDLHIVKTDVPLPSPPQGHYFLVQPHNRLQYVKGWKDTTDLTMPVQQSKVHILPFLVKKRLKQLLTEAKRNLDLRGEVRQSRKVSGSALTMYFKAEDREVAIDFAPVVRAHLPFESWLKWPRPGVQWPNQDTIQKIKQCGINAVAKKDFYWMLSFAEVEKKLVEKVDADGGKRKMVHRLMKKLNIDFWCNTNKPVISSYILKNIWFWEMEKYPHAKDWDNGHLWIRLKSMTEELLTCIRDRQLKQYFYSDFNLLKSKDVKELDIAASKIESFLNNPMHYFEG